LLNSDNEDEEMNGFVKD